MKMAIDETIVRQRLVALIDSKSQNEKRISELSLQAEILKKRLQIETN